VQIPSQYTSHNADAVATLSAWLQEESGGLPWTPDAHDEMLSAAEHIVSQHASTDPMADAVRLYIEFRSAVSIHLDNQNE
jgi:hypothetical protein